ncbi:MAG: MBL fold metallo-hydrolase [Acidobacteriota bacterium]
MDHDRRQFLIGAAGVALARGWAALPARPAAQGTRLILLGTKGGPSLGRTGGRKNPSTLLLIDGIPYLVDCGYGAARQLVAADVPVHTLRHLFITHHHSDHNLEFGALAYSGWATGQPTRLDAWGPPGLEGMARAFFDYMKFDIETRIEDEGRPDLRKLVTVHEFERPGVVLQNEQVKVTAALVRHPPIRQAYAYRFDTKDRSIVISGDTTHSPELAELAKGADVLVHEVLYLPGLEALLKRAPDATKLRAHLLASHTVSEDAGRIAASAGVNTLVLSHFVPGDDPSITDEQWSEGARRHFKGRIIVGKDLLEIPR